jgi:hypothetical protein
MRVVSLIPCREVQSWGDGTFELRNAGISAYDLPGFPDKNGVVLFVHVEVEDFDRVGDHKVEYKLMLGTQQCSYASHKFEIGPERKSLKLIHAFPIEFPTDGKYSLAAFLDGIYASQVALDVRRKA